MTKEILDKETLIRFAKGFSLANGLMIGIYDKDCEEIFECDAFSQSEILSAKNKLGEVGIESIVDISSVSKRISAIAIRESNGKLQAFCMIGSNSYDKLVFDSHLSIIETVLSSYFKEREAAVNLSIDVKDKEKEGNTLNSELERNEAITEVLGKLESDKDFPEICREVLEICGRSLSLSNVFLLNLDNENEFTFFSSWSATGIVGIQNKTELLGINKLPFSDNRPYTVSSDSRMPEEFREFFESLDISAGIFLPINYEGGTLMYLCATMDTNPRHWTLTEVGFLTDVRRIIASIYSKHTAKNNLTNSYAVVESVIKNISSGVAVIDNNEEKLLFTNDAFDYMFKNSSDLQRFLRRIKNTPEKMEQIREYQLETANIYVSIALGMIRWVDDSYVRIATVFDITENKQFEERLERNANIDTLTGIYNRSYFLKELNNILSNKHKSGALIFINIDGFKDINVTSGNDSGDILLSSIAKFLIKLTEDKAEVYRIGGDEFAIVICDSNNLDAVEASRAIISRFKAPWQLKYKDCYLTASIGIARFPEDADDVSTVVKYGDIALKEARKQGIASVVIFEPEMEVKLKNEILLRNFLVDSVKNNCNGMQLNKQKVKFIINNQYNDGYLADLSFDAPELGNKKYFEFLPIAKKQKLLFPIMEMLISEAIKDCRYQNDFGYPDTCFGIPIDTIDFVTFDVVSFLKETMEKENVNPDKIIIVLNGSINDSCISELKSRILEVKKSGAHIAFAYPGDLTDEGLTPDADVVIN